MQLQFKLPTKTLAKTLCMFIDFHDTLKKSGQVFMLNTIWKNDLKGRYFHQIKILMGACT